METSLQYIDPVTCYFVSSHHGKGGLGPWQAQSVNRCGSNLKSRMTRFRGHAGLRISESYTVKENSAFEFDMNFSSSATQGIDENSWQFGPTRFELEIGQETANHILPPVGDEPRWPRKESRVQ